MGGVVPGIRLGLRYASPWTNRQDVPPVAAARMAETPPFGGAPRPYEGGMIGVAAPPLERQSLCIAHTQHFSLRAREAVWDRAVCHSTVWPVVFSV